MGNFERYSTINKAKEIHSDNLFKIKRYPINSIYVDSYYKMKQISGIAIVDYFLRYRNSIDFTIQRHYTKLIDEMLNFILEGIDFCSLDLIYNKRIEEYVTKDELAPLIRNYLYNKYKDIDKHTLKLKL